MEALMRVADVAERYDSAGQQVAGGFESYVAAGRRWLAGRWGARVVYSVLLAEVGVLVWFAFSFIAVDFYEYMWGGHAVTRGTLLYLGSAGRNYFTYPPLSAALFAPIAQLPRGVGQAGWELVSVAALALAAWAILKLARRQPTRTEIAAITAAAMVLEPVWRTLFTGQINTILLAVVAMDVWWVSQGRRGGGLGIGIAAAVKLTPGIFIVLFLLTRRTRAAVTAAVTFAVGGLIGYLVAPADSRLYWTRYFYDTKRVFPAYVGNQSIYGAAIRIFGGPGHVGLWYLPLAIAVAVVGLGSAAVLARRGDWLRAMAVTGVTGLLVSPVSWTHHWVDVIPALIALALDGRRGRIAAAGGFLLFALAPVWWTPHSLLQPAYGFHGLVTVVANCYVVAGLTFLAYMGWHAYQTLSGYPPWATLMIVLPGSRRSGAKAAGVSASGRTAPTSGFKRPDRSHSARSARRNRSGSTTKKTARPSAGRTSGGPTIVTSAPPARRSGTERSRTSPPITSSTTPTSPASSSGPARSTNTSAPRPRTTSRSPARPVVP